MVSYTFYGVIKRSDLGNSTLVISRISLPTWISGNRARSGQNPTTDGKKLLSRLRELKNPHCFLFSQINFTKNFQLFLIINDYRKRSKLI